MQGAMPASLSCVTPSTAVSDQGTENPGTSVQPLAHLNKLLGWL